MYVPVPLYWPIMMLGSAHLLCCATGPAARRMLMLKVAKSNAIELDWDRKSSVTLTGQWQELLL